MGEKNLHLEILEVKVGHSHDLTIGVVPCGGGGPGDIGDVSVTVTPGDNSDTCTPQPGLPTIGGGGGSAGGNSGPFL
jgi:hypothetical protein